MRHPRERELNRQRATGSGQRAAAVRRVQALVLLAGLIAAGGCRAPQAQREFVFFPPPPAPARVVHLQSFSALDELVRPKRSWLDALRGGTLSAGVVTPAGLAYRDGTLYVCDIGAGVVHAWDLGTGATRTIGGSLSAPLKKPVGVCLDDTGRVFIADVERAEVVVCAPDGSQIWRLGAPGDGAWKPVAVAAGGGRIYAADALAHRVCVFDSDSEDLLATIGSAGSGDGQFYFPTGVALDAERRLYVSDTFNGRVSVFDDFHAPLHTIGQPGDRYGDLGSPRQLAVSDSGIIAIADPQFAHVHLFNLEGALLMLLGGPGEGAGRTPLPVGVAWANDLPEALRRDLLPDGFEATGFLFVSNTIGPRRISLYAVGAARATAAGR
jgi:DNA-binding beta-propeller fold protein YncE